MIMMPTAGVLSVGDGRLMTTMDDVSKVLGLMLGRPVLSHEIPALIERAGPVVAEHFPVLKGDPSRPCHDVLLDAVEVHGSMMDAAPLAGTLA